MSPFDSSIAMGSSSLWIENRSQVVGRQLSLEWPLNPQMASSCNSDRKQMENIGKLWQTSGWNGVAYDKAMNAAPVPVMPCWMCEGQGLGRLGWLPPTPPDISPPHSTIIVGHSMLASMRRWQFLWDDNFATMTTFMKRTLCTVQSPGRGRQPFN